MLEPVSVPGPRDTIVEMRACLSGAGKRIGSFHAIIQFDTTRARAISIAAPRFGTVVHNESRPGHIAFAGATPAGFEDGPVLLVALRLARAGRTPPVSLDVKELNSTEPKSMLAQAHVHGWPSTRTAQLAQKAEARRQRGGKVSVRAAPPTAPPVIERITPQSFPADTSIPPMIEIVGRHFAAEGNVIRIGPGQIRSVTSANGGTIIRFLLPRRIVVADEAPPMQVGPGDLEIRVRTVRGESNAVTIHIR